MIIFCFTEMKFDVFLNIDKWYVWKERVCASALQRGFEDLRSFEDLQKMKC